MNKSDKYRKASLVNLTPEQLATARANYAYGAKRFPEEHARTASLIEAKGLGNHREILEYYSRHKSPMPERMVRTVGAYADTSYSGPFHKGEQQGPDGLPIPPDDA